ncbi:unnamed protein product [Periconia digitata]|uniref:Uncharacterized protein n=1 Tax=Periconia digitata TaxID=1303443 RepID=A0A9W4UIZ5_9PLEO|nr:unnamed protein product [Periconia digitata]
METPEQTTTGQQAMPETRAKTGATTQTTIASVPDWPLEAQTLKKKTWTRYMYILGDILLVLLPIYFILLGVAVVTLNGKPTKDNRFGEKVEAAIQLGPTIFPIVFAAICGRSMKMIARYIAERRAKLGTLELLMASQSVWGTIESQFLMQRLTLVGVNLLFLWALSPLGGQASLRLMNRGDKLYESTEKIRYMSTGPGSIFWGLSTTYVDSGKFADATALYNTALMAPVSNKLGPRDPWGNVKIPRLEQYSISSTEWHDVPAAMESAEAYSSLVGLPIVGLPAHDDSSFTVETTYLTVNCTPFGKTYIPKLEGAGNNEENWPLIEKLVPGQVWKNKSEQGTNPFGLGDIGAPNVDKTSFFIDTDRPLWSQSEQTLENAAYLQRFEASLGSTNVSLLVGGNSSFREPRNLLYATKSPRQREDGTFRTNELNLGVTKCALTQTHVEVMIQCSGELCAARKLRTSLSDKRSPNYTGLEHTLVMQGFTAEFPFAVAPAVGSSSATEHFLNDSSDYPFVRNNRHGGNDVDVLYVDLAQVPSDIFSRRLSSLLSTFYQLTIQPSGYWGSLPNNLSLYGPDVLPVDDFQYYFPGNKSISNSTLEEWGVEVITMMDKEITAPFIGATTTANVTSTEQVFVCQYAWLALLLTCSTTILLTGFAGLVLKRRTLGPELFGFVASMTYENPYVRIPEGGSTLDAMERAKLLKDVEVCVGDVHGDGVTGHIAFSAGVPVRKLWRGRLYA